SDGDIALSGIRVRDMVQSYLANPIRQTNPLPPAWTPLPVHRVIPMPTREIAAVIIEPNSALARLILSGTSRQICRACMPISWFHPARIAVQIPDCMPRANRIAAAVIRLEA